MWMADSQKQQLGGICSRASLAQPTFYYCSWAGSTRASLGARRAAHHVSCLGAPGLIWSGLECGGEDKHCFVLDPSHPEIFH